MDIRMKVNQENLDDAVEIKEVKTDDTMDPIGGTEILHQELLRQLKKIMPDWTDKINLILSRCDLSLLDPEKKNIVWLHLNYDQDFVQEMNNPEFVQAVDHFVFVSHWQYEKYRRIFEIPAFKCTVIPNAIHPIEHKERSKYDKIRLIYTSTPWRGLDILLDSFSQLTGRQIELDVYSSTKIYGSDFDREVGPQFADLFKRCEDMKNVNYHGYVTNDKIKEALTSSHILAYPSTFEETSCLSAIEALAAGCKVVTTDLGALPETCGLWADYITIGFNRDILVERYTALLANAIDNYWGASTQETLKEQSQYYNKYHSWEKIIPRWKKLFNTVRDLKKKD
jgi:glycosyltransferase involved in cell wall biosynthesis